MSYTVHINGNDYPVAAAHINDLRANLLSAARAGGGFVNLPLPTRPGTAALVFPESSVWIEPAPREITAERADELPQPVFIDLDDDPFPT
ncbi:hypothetical protein [Pseudoclavibacter terrae]|uniref:Uncharacterized protein n=1 Tax=Pseudoclavibacter terrae TaxID=1530195 RepID=A0A7J5AXJ6_9MICO|nr:hypothetical protein [Pseudoclavibacter terrae]KAB1636054.1 hypothetical protein F8O03_17480 [Pseudoclavibacter terrae]